jgi:hypothetical protein
MEHCQIIASSLSSPFSPRSHWRYPQIKVARHISNDADLVDSLIGFLLPKKIGLLAAVHAI